MHTASKISVRTITMTALLSAIAYTVQESATEKLQLQAGTILTL